ncbi:FAD binding domain-containing protein [Toxoplasma gondii ME49]|uniref:FAD binding domain-containing protein n=2 Tax=Toxoplasma gondii TaxID=5811 RepID=S8F5M8_TOXGM|nr:FAD binding domain-containing protein [Toxoplasma gondii ME49]EPT31136.1 FAD binding domain-containing protein [Toxoplasma gondii ME49]|eukprot:XP_018637836.1 FAD binding domain-containing protein [Toxoplasma gondii ME49]
MRTSNSDAMSDDAGLRAAVGLAKEAAARQLAAEKLETESENYRTRNYQTNDSQRGYSHEDAAVSRASSFSSSYDSEDRSLSRYSFSSSFLDHEDDSYGFSSNASESSFQSSCAGEPQTEAESFYARPEEGDMCSAIPSQVDVVIVGAGPAGLTLAIDCQRQGLSYLCVDVRQDVSLESRSILLHPRTLEIMQDLGVAEALILRGIRLRGLRMFLNGALASETPLGPLVVPPQPSGQALASLPSALLCGSASGARHPFSPFPGGSSLSSSSTPFPYAVVVDQSVVEAVLRDKLRRLGGHVHRPVAVWRLEHQDTEEPSSFPVPLHRRRKHHSRRRRPYVEPTRGRSLERASRSPREACASPDDREPHAADAAFSSLSEDPSSAEKERQPARESASGENEAPRAGAREADPEGQPAAGERGEEAREMFVRHSASMQQPREGRGQDGEFHRGKATPGDAQVKPGERRRFTTTAEPKCWRSAQEGPAPVATGFLINEEREDEEDVEGYPVIVHLAKLSDAFGSDDPAFISVRCRYVVGCDGAKSMIRKASSISFDGASRPSEFLLADVSLDWSALAGGLDHQEASSLSDPSMVVPDAAALEREAALASLHQLLQNSPLDCLNLFLSGEGSMFLAPLLPPFFQLPRRCPESSASSPTLAVSDNGDSDGGRGDTGSDEETGARSGCDREKEGGLGRAGALLAHTEASGNLRWRLIALRDSSEGLSSCQPSSGNAAMRGHSRDADRADANAADSDRGLCSERRKGTTGTSAAVSSDEVVQFIEKMIPGTCVRRIHWSCAYASGSRLATRFKQRRCFLAGDAAHAHPPFFSEGLNLGIQDVYNLGWKLGSVLKGGASTRLLESYHRERHQIAQEVMARAGRTLNFIFGSAGKPSFLSRCVLKFMGPLLSRLPALADAVSRNLSVIDVTYQAPTDVLGVAGTTPYASLEPGMQVPDCLVKVTEIFPERTPLPPPAPPTYLYELLGSSQHVLLLHLLLLPAGSRVKNVFGCEMPGAPLAARYNATCFSALMRLARLATLASSERRGGTSEGFLRALPRTDWLYAAAASHLRASQRDKSRERKTSGCLRIIWCVHGTLAPPHTVATATSITTALPRETVVGLSRGGASFSSSRSFSFLRRFSSASIVAPHRPFLPLFGIGEVSAAGGEHGKQSFFSLLTSERAKAAYPSSSGFESGDALDTNGQSHSVASSVHSASSREEATEADSGGGASDVGSPEDGDDAAAQARSLDSSGEGSRFSGSLGSFSEGVLGQLDDRRRDASPGMAPTYGDSLPFSNRPSDEELGGTSTFLMRRRLLDLLPSGILSQLQGPQSPHPSLLLVDFVDELSTKFGLKLAAPGSAYADTRSGAFTLIRPDGHVAQGGYVGDAVASRGLLDYFMNYF